jgi:tetratricopeptide (TPR) repeat protein
MKAAKRLSIPCSLLILTLSAAAPGFGQSDLRGSSPFESGRAPWVSTPGSVVSAEYATAGPSTRPIFEPAPSRHGGANRPPSGTISLARLRNQPPSKARKEVEKATKAIAEGDREKAIEHYEKAIEIYPNYVEAYNNLGVQCLRAGRNEEALGALEKAVELDPDSVEPHLNLAVALHGLGQLDAAAFQAERAVEIAPRSASANLGLGLVLAAQGRKLEEAVRRLDFASAEHPGAALAAADALLQLNRPKEAQAALRSFLSRSSVAVK